MPGKEHQHKTFDLWGGGRAFKRSFVGTSHFVRGQAESISCDFLVDIAFEFKDDAGDGDSG